jgi:hypothetical protein
MERAEAHCAALLLKWWDVFDREAFRGDGTTDDS